MDGLVNGKIGPDMSPRGNEFAVQARRSGPKSLPQSGSTSLGGKTGVRDEKWGPVYRPAHISGSLIRLYAALALFVAVVRG